MSFFPEDRMAELREIFFESARELLQALNEEALALEKNPADGELVRSLRRTVHTLKGDSAAMGYRELSTLAHELEEVLTPELAARRGSAMVETILAAADLFTATVEAYRANLQPPSAEQLRAQIQKLSSGAPAPAPTVKPARPEPKFEWSEYEQVVMVETAARGTAVYNLALTLDALSPAPAAVEMVRKALRDCGNILAMHPDEHATNDRVEMVEAALASTLDEPSLGRKLRIPSVVRELVIRKYTLPASPAAVRQEFRPIMETAAAPPAQTQKGLSAPAAMRAAQESVLRVDTGRIDSVLNLVGELIIGKSMLMQTISDFGQRFPKDPLHLRLSDAMGYQARVLNDLQKSVMKIRMVPVEQLFRRFPRVVRDAAAASSKEVVLEVSGEQTDLDKSILDQLAEPLTHLVRNAVDHGIEPAQKRVTAGKPAAGRVRLNAYHQGHEIVIEVTDDGRGIDSRRVVAKAVENGIVSATDVWRLTEKEALELIFHPGFSTAESVTQLSGRGVGLDVVQTTLERLKGSVSVETEVGQGTTFLLKVPLTLAIIQALLFRAEDRLYAVPLSAVMEITRADEADIHHLGSAEIIRLRDEVIPVVRLGEDGTAARESGKVFVIVIAASDRKFGLVVARLIGEEELVIKAVDDPLVASDLVSGASILGDGTVVLVLNVSAVVGRLGRLQPAGASA
jgi:two-component system chemotaxis sensor kinase CheA